MHARADADAASDGQSILAAARPVDRGHVLKHVNGRKAVAFCVNIRHGEALAELFRTSGVPARSVSGRMPRSEREKYLAAFHQGDQ